MKRIGKLRHNYHDATLRSVRLEERRITLDVDLCPVCNNKVPESASLTFEMVQNMDEIRARFECRESSWLQDVNDEIVGVAKLSATRYLVDLNDRGGLEIDCRGISEI
jgi:hypothetical protein